MLHFTAVSQETFLLLLLLSTLRHVAITLMLACQPLCNAKLTKLTKLTLPHALNAQATLPSGGLFMPRAPRV